MSGRRKRILTSDELALWAQVTRHVAPMPRGKARPKPPEAAEPPGEPAVIPTPAPAAQPAPGPPPLVPLERRLRQRLSRGRHRVDAVIDLHGMRQSQAHEALRRFLARAQAQGAGIVLVVTGKGGGAGEASHGEERGVLRRMVPHWLRLPDLRPIVLGFEEAGVHHGGAGALYVRIRRAAPAARF